MTIHDIITELNAENGSNYKMAVLKKHKDYSLLKKVLKMTYDKTSFKYNITMKNIIIDKKTIEHSLEDGLDLLERFHDKQFTGNAAKEILEQHLSRMSDLDADVISKILNRDIRINMGRSNINKVFKDLITKPVYQRCDIFTKDSEKNGKPVKGTFRKISFKNGAYLDLKADGTYREMSILDGNIQFHSRSGEEYFYPLILEDMQNMPEGRYFGELTVELTEELLVSVIDKLSNSKEDNSEMIEEITNNFNNGLTTLPRSLGNGLINSDDVPHKNLMFDLWEYVTESEYYNAANKIKNVSQLSNRRDFLITKLSENNSKYVKHIEFVVVYSPKEAMEKVSEWMNLGLEGGVLKNTQNVFRDGTHPEQLKMKLEIDLEVRVTGFTEGRKGTKRALTFGAMTFCTDDGKIVGRTSGFSDAMLEELNKNRENIIGKVFTIQCNDITKASTSETYALSHPRFKEFRDDKDSTDTLERALEQKESSKLFEH